MLYVSIFVELLRSRPALAVWIAALVQAALWFLVPSFFYWAPPGEAATVVAVGHEFRLGTYLGPPLAFWVADVAFILAGRSMVGVYLLSQICVVTTYWAVFALGRSIVGAHHAALAVLLMVGISVFAVPTPDFGPVTLSMALWSLVLLHYWRAVGEGRRAYWVALAIEIGLLLLSTYAGLLLVVLMVLFTLVNKRALSMLGSMDPWYAGIVALIVIFPHLLWLIESDNGSMAMLSRLRTAESVSENFNAWLRQMALIIAAHTGLIVMVAMVVGWPWSKHEPSPVIVRRPVDTFGRQFIYFFAIVPALAATFAAVLVGWSGPAGGVALLVVLTGLSVVVAAGDNIEFSHQRVVIPAWFGLLLVPPAMAILALLALPWVGVEMGINQPADQMAQFFADSFQRRIGSPLRIVAGDQRTATLVAIGAQSRPSVFLDAAPEHSPWVSMEDVRTNGAIVVWPTNDTSGTPPPEIKQRFPEIVPEVPRAFERPSQGRLPLLRIGWAVIRPQPQNEPVATPSPSQPSASSPSAPSPPTTSPATSSLPTSSPAQLPPASASPASPTAPPASVPFVPIR
jgi:4-amino-4-deoxy-L-arabinose transferase-like glycosyltransferase